MTQKARFRELERYGFGPNVMKKNKVCARCGKLVKASARTCPECGELLSSETLFDRYKRQHQCCYECDTVLSPGSLYCPNCGTAVFHHENNLEGGKNDEK